MSDWIVCALFHCMGFPITSWLDTWSSINQKNYRNRTARGTNNIYIYTSTAMHAASQQSITELARTSTRERWLTCTCTEKQKAYHLRKMRTKAGISRIHFTTWRLRNHEQEIVIDADKDGEISREEFLADFFCGVEETELAAAFMGKLVD